MAHGQQLTAKAVRRAWGLAKAHLQTLVYRNDPCPLAQIRQRDVEHVPPVPAAQTLIKEALRGY